MTINQTKDTKAVTKAKRIRKPRRQLPETLDFIPADEIPNALDVVSGRGGGSNHHEGNKPYWKKILSQRANYKVLQTNENGKKTAIAQQIVDSILLLGGRFLQKDAKTKRWFVLPSKIVLDKVKQALRDEYIPKFAEASVNLAQRILKPESSDSISNTSLGSVRSLDLLKPPSTTEMMSFSNPNLLLTSKDDSMMLENFPSLSLRDVMKSFKSGDLGCSLRSFSKAFTGTSLNNDFPLEIGKLPSFSKESSQTSPDLLAGNSLDALFRNSLGGSELPSDVGDKKNGEASKMPSWFAIYDKDVVPPAFPVHAV